MSKTLARRIDADEIKAEDIIKPDKGMTFYLDGYGEFTFQFPAPVWMSCDEDEQNDGLNPLLRNAFIDQITAFGKIAEGFKMLDHVSIKDMMTILIELYRRLDAHIQYWMWVMEDSDETMFEIVSEIVADDNSDINRPSPEGLGHLLSLLGGM